MWNPISTALRGISCSPQSWMELILFHEDTFHSILSVCFPLSFFLPPPLLPLVSSEHTEIEQAWLMQHLSPPNVSFAQPFYAWLLFGKFLFLHLPEMLLNFHISSSIKKLIFSPNKHKGWIRRWSNMHLIFKLYLTWTIVLHSGHKSTAATNCCIIYAT